MTTLINNIPLIASILFLIGSELMSLNPKLQSNGWIQLIVNVSKKLSGK